jgi:hypothetical protein
MAIETNDALMGSLERTEEQRRWNKTKKENVCGEVGRFVALARTWKSSSRG